MWITLSHLISVFFPPCYRNLQAAIGAYYDFESPGSSAPSMSFVKDVTIGEGESIPPDTPFIKTWRIQNTGNVYRKWNAFLTKQNPEFTFMLCCRFRVVASRCVSEVHWWRSVWSCELCDGSFSGSSGDSWCECTDVQSSCSRHVPGPVEDVHRYRTLLRRWTVMKLGYNV